MIVPSGGEPSPGWTQSVKVLLEGAAATVDLAVAVFEIPGALDGRVVGGGGLSTDSYLQVVG
jgi:hypothetical protein